MHIMVYNVPDMIRHYGSIKKSSGQGKNTMNQIMYHKLRYHNIGDEKNK